VSNPCEHDWIDVSPEPSPLVRMMRCDFCGERLRRKGAAMDEIKQLVEWLRTKGKQ
jgi:hypothetical protein